LPSSELAAGVEGRELAGFEHALVEHFTLAGGDDVANRALCRTAFYCRCSLHSLGSRPLRRHYRVDSTTVSFHGLILAQQAGVSVHASIVACPRKLFRRLVRCTQADGVFLKSRSAPS